MHCLKCPHSPSGTAHSWVLCIHIRQCTHACVTAITCISTTGPPSFQQFDPFYYVITGDAFSLNCTATDNPNSRQITFSWYRNNKHITHITTIIASDTTSQYMKSTSQLYIDKLDSDQHSGRYICVANNRAISTTTVIVES